MLPYIVEGIKEANMRDYLIKESQVSLNMSAVVSLSAGFQAPYLKWSTYHIPMNVNLPRYLF